MPDWLRLRLVHDLPAGRQETVRGALDRLLLGAERLDADDAEAGPTLAIAQATGGGGPLGGAGPRRPAPSCPGPPGRPAE